MSANELSDEIRAGVRFYGWFKNSFLLGIAGIQNVGSIDLIRPLLRVYCLPETRLGSALLQHLLSLAQTSTILVGTWEDARWAVQFYQQYGFTLVSREEKDVPLQEYWNNPGGKSRHRLYLRKDL